MNYLRYQDNFITTGKHTYKTEEACNGKDIFFNNEVIMIDGRKYEFKYIFYNATYNCLFTSWSIIPPRISKKSNNYYIGEL